MQSTEVFKTCGMCGKQWPRWQDLVVDRGVKLLGLQAVPMLPDANLLVFDHECGTTISVLAKKLRHLLDDPHEGERLALLAGTAGCNKHCNHLEDLLTCDNACRNARDRRLTLLVRELLARGELPPALLSR